MGYAQQALTHCIVPYGTAVLAARTLTAANAVHGEYLVLKRAEVKRIMAIVDTAIVAGLTAPVITVRRRLTAGSSSGQTTIGTLTIPTATASGKILYKDVTPVILNAGDTVTFEQTTQATDSGSAAGSCYFAFEAHPVSEDRLIEADMVASA